MEGTSMAFEETHESHVIEPVKTFGVMTVYRRKDWREWRLPKFVVFHIDGRALEDFRTRKAAFRWAEDNKNG